MTEHPAWRGKALGAMRRYFQRHSFPRLILALLLIAAGFCGFGLSALLLRMGVEQMGIRYPAGVIGGYAAFLLLLRMWVAWERRRFDPDNREFQDALREEPQEPAFAFKPSKRSSWTDAIDLPSSGWDDGCLPALLIAAVLGLVVLACLAIGGASVLISEVFIDIVLTGILYRKLRHAADGHWLGTAVRQTWVFVLGAAVCLSVIGFVLAISAPGAETIGQAVRQIWETPGPGR